jgi:hypothetical protein
VHCGVCGVCVVWKLGFLVPSRAFRAAAVLEPAFESGLSSCFATLARSTVDGLGLMECRKSSLVAAAAHGVSLSRGEVICVVGVWYLEWVGEESGLCSVGGIDK